MYTGVSFAGQVGLFTAQRPDAVTVSFNERSKGFVWQNIIQAILNKNALPIAFLIRKVVSTEGMDFDHAMKMLSHVPLITCGYLIVGGVNVGQGAVVTRNRVGTADIWYLSKDAGKTR